MHLSFLGAAREVTGSCFLVESGKLRFAVDCGMHQGGKTAELKNRHFPPFDPERLDFVLLTHAHIDHSGLIPRLVNLGFRGPVYCTRATADLVGVMWPDSAFILEKEVEWRTYDKRKHRGRIGPETAPLYTVAQAKEALRRIKAVAYDAVFSPHKRVRVSYRDAGHILGAASLEVWLDEDERTEKLVFSGDLGMPGRPVMNDPTPIAEADWLLIESTYGDRLHKTLEATIEELVDAINDTLVRRKGNVIIPAFTVGRTQEILYLLVDLIRKRRIPETTAIFVDSPMAKSATEITLKHQGMLDAASQDLLDWTREKDGHGPYVRFTESVEDSVALNKITQGAVIISASGMCDAGRIKHHLKFNLPRENCSVIITGFQAEGTLGRRLVDRAPVVRLFQEDVPVRAAIYTLGGLSAHADRDALLGWLGHFTSPPKRTFVVHGEEMTAVGFAERIREQLGWKVEVPVTGAVYELGAGRARLLEQRRE